MTTGDEPSLGGDKRIDISGAEPKLGGEAAILHLVEMLEHTDRKVRYRAALKLAESGDDRVFDTLVEMLQDEDGSPRLLERAALALGQLGEDRAIEPLVASTDIIGAVHVVRALAKIGTDKALDHIEELFRTSWSFKLGLAMVDSAPDMASQRVIDFLIGLIKNDDCYTSSHAASCLWKMANRAIDKLLPLLNHELYQVRVDTIMALRGSKDERLVEPLIALLDDDHMSVVRSAVKSLGLLGDERATPGLIKLLDLPATYIVEEAIRSLGKIGDARAVEPLRLILEKALDSDPGSRETGLLKIIGPALENIDDPRAFDVLEKAIREGEERKAFVLVATLPPTGRSAALNTVFWQRLAATVYKEVSTVPDETEYPQVVRSLIVVLKHHPDPEMRAEAVSRLAETKDKQLFEPLIEALGDQVASVRELAVDALGQLGDSRAVELLIRHLHNNPVEEGPAPEAAALVLGKLGDRRAVEPLLEAIAQDRIVGQAACALGQLGDRRAVEPLIEVLCEFRSASIAAAVALGELGDARTVEALKTAMYRADQEMFGCRRDDQYYFDFNSILFDACKEALEHIGTPEALAAIEDLPFRDL